MTGKKTETIDTPSFWWEEADEDISSALYSHVTNLQDQQCYFLDNIYSFLQLYSGVNSGWASYDNFSQSLVNEPRVSYNIVQSCCQAAANKVTRNRPHASFLTFGADYSMRRKAKGLERVVEGQFYRGFVHKEQREAFFDCCIFGTGCVKVMDYHGEIRVERVFPGELIVDDTEAIYGRPRQFYQKKHIAREHLRRLYPDLCDELGEASGIAEDRYTGEKNASDMVEVIEGWHLPSTPAAVDGRHTIVVSSCVLLDEVYEEDDFPFVFMRWEKKRLGFWGLGIAEQLLGIQANINKTFRRIQEQQHLATPKVFIEKGSKVSQGSMTNKVFGTVNYSGRKPEFYMPRAVGTEIYQHLESQIRRGYEVVGISQLTASSRKPVGLESGKALREFTDIETERFSAVAREYEEAYMAIAHKVVNLCGKMAKKYKKKFFAYSKRGIEFIDWKDVDLSRDEFMMQILPSSNLPRTPAARKQYVEELVQAGMLTPDMALKLLEIPDIESYTDMRLAYVDIVDRIIENIIEEGIYETPEPFMNLEFAMKRVNDAYLKARLDGVEEERLDLLRNWVMQAESLLPDPVAPAPAPMPMPTTIPEEGII